MKPTAKYLILLFLVTKVSSQEFRKIADSEFVTNSSANIEIGYYEPDSGKTPIKGDLVPLKYIEHYSVINGQFHSLVFRKDGQLIKTIPYSKSFKFVNEFHKNLTYQSIAQNLLLEGWETKEPGFHRWIEVINGQLDYSPKVF